jgi:prolyl-tRNA synthetase
MIDPKDGQSHEIVEKLLGSTALAKVGADILIDDRPDTAGVKFNDADLLGIPLRVILGPKNLKNGKVEIKLRKTGESFLTDIPNLEKELLDRLDKID